METFDDCVVRSVESRMEFGAGMPDVDGEPQEVPRVQRDEPQEGPRVQCDDPQEEPCEQQQDAPQGDSLMEKSSGHNKDLGKRGEDAAAAYLKRRGYDILERNWTCFAGEADIIARDEDGSYVFIEVKTRSNIEHGMPEEAVTFEKRDRYEKIAASYLQRAEGSDSPVRFDVVSILVIAEDRALIRHHINAWGTW